MPAGEALGSAVVQGRRQLWWCGGTLSLSLCSATENSLLLLFPFLLRACQATETVPVSPREVTRWGLAPCGHVLVLAH